MLSGRLFPPLSWRVSTAVTELKRSVTVLYVPAWRRPGLDYQPGREALGPALGFWLVIVSGAGLIEVAGVTWLKVGQIVLSGCVARCSAHGSVAPDDNFIDRDRFPHCYQQHRSVTKGPTTRPALSSPA